MTLNVESIQLDSVVGAAPTADGQMVYDSTSNKFIFQENGVDVPLGTGTAGGDLGGTYPNPTVTGLTIASEAQGDILYRNATDWVRLAPGTSGQVLQTNGAAANPTWVTPAGGSLTYTEIKLDFTHATSGSWTEMTLTGVTANTVVEITMRSTTLNNAIGVREVGSALTTRRMQIDADSAYTVLVVTDASSKIEVYAGVAGNAQYFAMGELS